MEAVQTLRVVVSGADLDSQEMVEQSKVEGILYFTDKTARDWNAFNQSVTPGHMLINGSIAIPGELSHRYEMRHHYLLIRQADSDNVEVAVQGDNPADWVPLFELRGDVYQSILKAASGKWEVAQLDSQRRVFEQAIVNTLEGITKGNDGYIQPLATTTA